MDPIKDIKENETPAVTEKKEKKEKKEQYVTVKSFNKLLGAVEDLAKSIHPGVLTAPSEPVKPEDLKPGAEITPKPEEPDATPVPPAWRKMVDEILGTDFGLHVIYPDKGAGFLIKIIVPDEKSNASQAYKEFYKVDIRTKAISYSEGVDGIKLYCEKVAGNLGIIVKK